MHMYPVQCLPVPGSQIVRMTRKCKARENVSAWSLSFSRTRLSRSLEPASTVWTEQYRTGTSHSLTTSIVPERLVERVWCTKSKSSLLNIFFRLSGFQPSLLLNLLLLRSEFLDNCYHYSPPPPPPTPPLQKNYPICDDPLSRMARRSIAALQKSR